MDTASEDWKVTQNKMTPMSECCFIDFGVKAEESCFSFKYIYTTHYINTHGEGQQRPSHGLCSILPSLEGLQNIRVQTSCFKISFYPHVGKTIKINHLQSLHFFKLFFFYHFLVIYHFLVLRTERANECHCIWAWFVLDDNLVCLWICYNRLCERERERERADVSQ